MGVDLEKLTGHTPGPWTTTRCPCGDPVCNQVLLSVTRSDGRLDPADGALIAAAPELLAEVRALRARVAELEKAGDALAYWRNAQKLIDAHDAWRAIRSKPAPETPKGSTK